MSDQEADGILPTSGEPTHGEGRDDPQRRLNVRLNRLKDSFGVGFDYLDGTTAVSRYLRLFECWGATTPNNEATEIHPINLLPLQALNQLLDSTEKALVSTDLRQATAELISPAANISREFSEVAQGLVNDEEQDLGHESRLAIVRKLHDLAIEISEISASQRIKTAVKEAEEGVEHIRQVAGVSAEIDLASSFQAFAKKHSMVSNRLRVAVVLLVAVTIAILVYLLLVSVHNDIATWIDLVRRLAVSLPGLALAAYLARESRHHRSAADWAESIEVQLRTINAFTDPLEERLRNEIRGDFGKRVFMSSFASAGKTENLRNVDQQPNTEYLMEVLKLLNQGK